MRGILHLNMNSPKSRNNFQNFRIERFPLLRIFNVNVAFLWKRYFDSYNPLENIVRGPFNRQIGPSRNGNGRVQWYSLRLEAFDGEIPCRIPRVPFIEAPIILVYARTGVACKSGRRKAATFSLLITSLLCYVTAFVRAWTEPGIIRHRE